MRRLLLLEISYNNILTYSEKAIAFSLYKNCLKFKRSKLILIKREIQEMQRQIIQ